MIADVNIVLHSAYTVVVKIKSFNVFQLLQLAIQNRIILYFRFGLITNCILDLV